MSLTLAVLLAAVRSGSLLWACRETRDRIIKASWGALILTLWCGRLLSGRLWGRRDISECRGGCGADWGASIAWRVQLNGATIFRA